MKFPSTIKAVAGPLRICQENPRYFSDDSGRAIYLTGSHTWNVLTEQVNHGVFNYSAYLNLLGRCHHNFFRMWCLELFSTPEGENNLLPYPRTGPGEAVDGKPKFDLSQFNEPYFDRMRERVIMACARGIYVGVLLFEGWWITQFGEEGWIGHPYHPANNIQKMPVERLQMHSLALPWVMERQLAYVHKVIDTVHDLDNVLYEVANEDGGGSVAWQEKILQEVRDYEASLGKKHHLVGLTFRYPGGSNDELFQSQADWISPNSIAPEGYNYKTNPPAADGSKVILADTDHIYSQGLGIDWVWKTFTRGLHPLLMEGWDMFEVEPPARLAMGDTLRFADQMDLTQMDPEEHISSTGYCLAHRKGKEFLVYQPDPGSFTIKLPENNVYTVTWFNPDDQRMIETEENVTGGESLLFSPPWYGHNAVSGVVVYLRVA